MSLPALSGDDIARLVGSLPTFGGTWLASGLDKAPVSERTRALFVLMEPPGAGPQTVGHWVMLWLQGRRAVYVDPFGMTPPLAVMRFVERCEKRLGERVRLVVSNMELENLQAESCGWWCMMVMAKLSQGQRLDAALSTFGPDTAENERLLQSWFASR